MSWKNILKGDASDMEEDYGMRSDQIVDRFAKVKYITLTDPKTGEYADFDYDDMSDDYETYPDLVDVKEGSRLDKFIKEKTRMSIHPSNKEEIERKYGFEMDV